MTEDEMKEYNDRFTRKLLKSILYTVGVIITTIFILGYIFEIIFEETALMVSLCTGIIFTIFYCTLTIIEEVRDIKKELSRK